MGVFQGSEWSLFGHWLGYGLVARVKGYLRKVVPGWSFTIPSLIPSATLFLNRSSTCLSSLKQYLVSGLLLMNVCFLIKFALEMSSQVAPTSPPYFPTSPVRGVFLSPIYHPTSPVGHFLPWEFGRFPDSFHLEYSHEECAEMLAPGHGMEETFAPICSRVQPQAIIHYEGSP